MREYSYQVEEDENINIYPEKGQELLQKGKIYLETRKSTVSKKIRLYIPY